MSTGMVTKARRELEDAGLLIVERKASHNGSDLFLITIRDIWAQNQAFESPKANEPYEVSLYETKVSLYETKVSPHETNNTTLSNTSINNISLAKIAKPEPTYEEFDNQADLPSSFVNEDKPKNKRSFISDEVKEIVNVFANIAHVKPPAAQSKRDYAEYQVTWWKPVKEMLRQCDDNVALTSELLEKAIEKQRKSGLPTGVPKSLLTSFMAEVSLNSKPKQMAKDPDGNWVEV